MLTEDQASGAMKVPIDRAEAERRHRFERVQGFLLTLYPALRRVPLDERALVFYAARRHTFRQWSVYASLGLYLALLILLPRERLFGSKNDLADAPAFLLIALALVPVLVPYMHMRSFTKTAEKRRDAH